MLFFAATQVNRDDEEKRAMVGPGRQSLRIGLLIVLIGMFLNMAAQQKYPDNIEDLPPLPVGQTSEQELEANDVKLFFIRLKPGEVLRLEALERDTDIRIAIGTRDRPLAVSDFGSRFDRETATVIARANIEAMIAIVAPEQKRSTFQLTATVKLVADKSDELRVMAEKLLSEAIQSIRENRQAKIASSKVFLQRAITKAEQANKFWHALGEPYWEALGLMYIGEAQIRLDKDEEAAANLDRAMALWKTLSASHNQALTLGYISTLYVKRSKHEESLIPLKQIASLLREIKDRKGEEETLRMIKFVYYFLGDRERAEVYDFAAFLRPDWADPAMADMIRQYAGLHEGMGSLRTGLYALELALEYARSANDNVEVAPILGSLGDLYLELGKTDDAFAKIQASLQIYKENGNQERIASSLARLCDISLKQNKQEEALAYANQALAVIGEADDDQVPASKSSQRDTANILSSVANAYTASGQPRKALKYLHAALWSSKRHGVNGLEAKILEGLMQVWQSLGYKRLATFYGKQAITIHENSRFFAKEFDQSVARVTPDRNLQKLYIKRNERTYKQLAGLLIEDGRLAEAQEVLSALKDQQNFDPSPPAHDPQITSIEQLTRRNVVALSSTPHEADSATRYDRATKKIVEIPGFMVHGETLTKENLDKLDIAIDEFAAEIKLIEAAYAQPASDNDKPPQTTRLRELQSVLRTLDTEMRSKTAAVYTIVADESYYALAITADDITSASQAIGRAQLNQSALQLWGLLQTDTYDPTRQSNQLYSIIFKPLEAKLPKDVKTILWSLDESLRYVPMAALFDGRQYLVERYNHVLFTRADREQLTRALKSPWTGTGFGSSGAQTVQLLLNRFSFDSLPGVSEELDGIFKQHHTEPGVISGELWLNSKFNQANFLAALKRHRPVVHIASHFNFHPGDEGLSFLLLGDGTAMTLNEMKKETTLFQGVELLTLSACNTAAQLPDATGREIDGFAELAQRLGADAIMASLWPVTDISTSLLMQDFYAKQQGEKLSKVEALRNAQLVLLRSTPQSPPLAASKPRRVRKTPIAITANLETTVRGAGVIYIEQKNAPPYVPEAKRPYAHPHYWAPFVLYGNPR